MKTKILAKLQICISAPLNENEDKILSLISELVCQSGWYWIDKIKIVESIPADYKDGIIVMSWSGLTNILILDVDGRWRG